MEKTTPSPEQLARITSLMDDVTMFRPLEQESRKKLIEVAETFVYEPGENLVEEGQPSDAFYLIAEGEVKVFSGRGEDRVHLTDMGPTSTFGEIGLLLDQVRTASITARNRVVALRFTKKVFTSLFKQIPAFGWMIAGGMARRLVSVSSQLDLPEVEEPRTAENEADRLLPVPFIERHRLLPLKMADNRLTVGFVDDPDPALIKTIHAYVPGVELENVRISRSYFDTVMRSRLGTGERRQTVVTTPDHPDEGTMLDPLLQRGVAEGVSDLHLTAGKRPYWRIDGELLEVKDAPELGHEQLREVFQPFMEERHLEELALHGDTDFGYTLGHYARFRVNLFRDMNGINASMRLIPSHVMTLDQLGLPDAVAGFCTRPSGLVMVTGPTGSGKSTTLAAMIDRVNQTRRDHIVTLEDPIEFLHPNKLSVVHQREIGGHATDFARAIRSSLREDPDVILVGETRDLDTLKMVLEVANTGHLVLATLHTNSAMSTINRIVDMFPSQSQNQARNTLSTVLIGVICQALCRRIGGGRIAAFETMVATRAIGALIREGKTQQLMTALQSSKRDGHILLNESLRKLVEDQLIDAEEALAKAYDPNTLETMLGLRRGGGVNA